MKIVSNPCVGIENLVFFFFKENHTSSNNVFFLTLKVFALHSHSFHIECISIYVSLSLTFILPLPPSNIAPSISYQI